MLRKEAEGPYRGLHQKSWMPSFVYEVKMVGQSPQSNVEINLESTEVPFPGGQIP